MMATQSEGRNLMGLKKDGNICSLFDGGYTVTKTVLSKLVSFNTMEKIKLTYIGPNAISKQEIVGLRILSK
jgi:hypothetical protein